MKNITESSKTIYSIIIALPIVLGFAFVLLANSSKSENESQEVAGIETSQMIQRISPDVFKFKVENSKEAAIIDIRTESEFITGHIEGSINIDFYSSSFTDEIGKHDKSKPYFIYGQSTNRSSAAASQMKALGFEEIYELEGGYGAWLAAGF